MFGESRSKVRSTLWKFIPWAVALGLPLTPWGQARLLGYILLCLVVGAGLWLTYSYLKTVRIQIDESTSEKFATTSAEGVLKGLILAFPTILVGALTFLSWQSAKELAPDSSTASNGVLVSINCTPESLPLRVRQEESVYAVYLHPKWGNELVKFLFQSTERWTVWPEPDRKVSPVGYRCELVNDGSAKLLALFVPFRVEFRAEARSLRSRTIEIGLEPIEPKKAFVFHIVDDSGWDPRVDLPERVSGRIIGEIRNRSVPVQYSTLEGMPPHLTGFSP